MDLGLNGAQLESVAVEYTATLVLSGARVIVIESPLVIEVGGETLALSPEDDPAEAFDPLRQLVGESVARADTDENGVLTVIFDGGAQLRVEPDPTYEAWNVSGPDGALVVCTPGGRLAVWSPQTDKGDTV